MLHLAILALFLPALSTAAAQDGLDAFCKMERQEDGYWCETDTFLLDPSHLEKGLCWKCETKPVKVRVCAKEYYGCNGCSEKRWKPAKCCAGDMAKKVSKARIEYRCIGTCAETSPGAKSCDNKICDSKGRKYKPRCKKTGIYPHGGSGH